MGGADFISTISPRFCFLEASDRTTKGSFLLVWSRCPIWSHKEPIICGSEYPPLNVAFSRLFLIPVQHDAPLADEAIALATFSPPSPAAPQQEGEAGVEGEQVEVVGDSL